MELRGLKLITVGSSKACRVLFDLLTVFKFLLAYPTVAGFFFLGWRLVGVRTGISMPGVSLSLLVSILSILTFPSN